MSKITDCSFCSRKGINPGYVRLLEHHPDPQFINACPSCLLLVSQVVQSGNERLMCLYLDGLVDYLKLQDYLAR